MSDSFATENERLLDVIQKLGEENERLKSEIAIQKNLTKQICFECNRRDNEINLLKNTIAGFRTGVRFMTENVNFGSRATKSELQKRLSMVFGYLGIMKNALERLKQTEINGKDAPDMNDGSITETNGTKQEIVEMTLEISDGVKMVFTFPYIEETREWVEYETNMPGWERK